MSLCVIPARGGSKRIPRKNIREFCGKPMIAWSIEAAIKSQCFDSVCVSTDDEEIASVAKQYGAEIPFMRPASLADDHTDTAAVIKHAIEWQDSHAKKADTVCCLYAIAPFVQATDLQKGFKILKSSGADFAFSVTSYAFPIQRAIRIAADQRIEMFQPEYFNTRSQDLEEAWHDAGQFYWGKASAWLEEKPIFTGQTVPVIVPRYRVQDIDTQEDWKRAVLMFSALPEMTL